jgi:hypothetical protein
MEYIKFLGGFIGVITIYYLLIASHYFLPKKPVVLIDDHYNMKTVG